MIELEECCGLVSYDEAPGEVKEMSDKVNGRFRISLAFCALKRSGDNSAVFFGNPEPVLFRSNTASLGKVSRGGYFEFNLGDCRELFVEAGLMDKSPENPLPE